MKTDPMGIYKEYRDGLTYKNTLGAKGIYEQSRINERFYTGDQWYGANCGNDRPLVRFNIIKRIGDFKMAQIVSSPFSVSFRADGIPGVARSARKIKELKAAISKDQNFRFEGEALTGEINTVMSALGNYYEVTSERVGFQALCEKALRNAYISGSSLIYTYWDDEIVTGLYADSLRQTKVKGDICCEVLDIRNVTFGDPALEDIESQPFILLSNRRDAVAVRREAAAHGISGNALEKIGDGDDEGKVLVLTKLYKEYKKNGECTVRCVKTTKNAVVRRPFDTGLRRYPMALFRWEEKSGTVYGESEVTYLIPNQIAINRMITANVWSSMAVGMPMMVVNGDTVNENITNDPGQIIRVFGSNEDVAGAVHFVSPPDSATDFDVNIRNLIENTLTQCGANETALGDSRPDNAAALITMRNAAVLPLRLVQNRYYNFIEQIARIWADFWVTQYGNRRLRIEDENGVWYLPFDAQRYRELPLNASVDVGADTAYSTSERIRTLSELYDKGILNKKQYIKRLPKGIIPDMSGLLLELGEEDDDDGV